MEEVLREDLVREELLWVLRPFAKAEPSETINRITSIRAVFTVVSPGTSYQSFLWSIGQAIWGVGCLPHNCPDGGKIKNGLRRHLAPDTDCRRERVLVPKALALVLSVIIQLGHIWS